MSSEVATRSYGTWSSSHTVPSLASSCARTTNYNPYSYHTQQIQSPPTPPFEQDLLHSADQVEIQSGLQRELQRGIMLGRTQERERFYYPSTWSGQDDRNVQQYTTRSQTRKTSIQAAPQIAPCLQIPKTINDSQGSLAELAAQLTCRFWFESLSLLEQAGGSSSTNISPIISAPEIIPSTGFRKFVTTMLSTTQVAQNVVLLALLFIFRLRRQNPSVKGKAGSEYRLLTVALMLGNKFLDDNTYTNKTWAEVAGISVKEVHLMEVEFLSNMKYNLSTSEEQWSQWQIQLGRFASYLSKMAPTLSSSSTSSQIIHSVRPSIGNIGFPSPPISFNASPPRALSPEISIPSNTAIRPPILPSPIKNTRKRILEEDDELRASKRRSFCQQEDLYVGPTTNTINSAPLQNTSGNIQLYYPRELKQLPSIHQQFQLNSSIYNTNKIGNNNTILPNPSTLGLLSNPSSRNQSPRHGSINISPIASLMPNYNIQMQASTQSPSILLAQRHSPYKPVRHVQTLLVPPPSRVMTQGGHIDYNQMHYQSLGRPVSEYHTGQLPYVPVQQSQRQPSSSSPSYWYGPSQFNNNVNVNHDNENINNNYNMNGQWSGMMFDQNGYRNSYPYNS